MTLPQHPTMHPFKPKKQPPSYDSDGNPLVVVGCAGYVQDIRGSFRFYVKFEKDGEEGGYSHTFLHRLGYDPHMFRIQNPHLFYPDRYTMPNRNANNNFAGPLAAFPRCLIPQCLHRSAVPLPAAQVPGTAGPQAAARTQIPERELPTGPAAPIRGSHRLPELNHVAHEVLDSEGDSDSDRDSDDDCRDNSPVLARRKMPAQGGQSPGPSSPTERRRKRTRADPSADDDVPRTPARNRPAAVATSASSASRALPSSSPPPSFTAEQQAALHVVWSHGPREQQRTWAPPPPKDRIRLLSACRVLDFDDTAPAYLANHPERRMWTLKGADGRTICRRLDSAAFSRPEEHPANSFRLLDAVRLLGNSDSVQSARNMPLRAKNTVHFVAASRPGIQLRTESVGHSKVVVLRIEWSPDHTFTVHMPDNAFDRCQEFHFLFVQAKAGVPKESRHAVDELLSSIVKALRKMAGQRDPHCEVSDVKLRFVGCEEWPRGWFQNRNAALDGAKEKYCRMHLAHLVSWSFEDMPENKPDAGRLVSFQSLAEYTEEWRKWCPLYGETVVMKKDLPKLHL